MKGSLAINYWTLGGFEGALAPCDALAVAAEMGWDGLELVFGIPGLNPSTPPDAVLAIRKRADELGVQVRTMASGDYWARSLTHPDPQVRASAVDYTREYLRTASLLGAETILVVPGHVHVPWDPSVPVVPYDQAWEWSLQAMRSLAGTAESCGVRMGLENVWNGFLQDPVAMRTFLDEVGSPWVGAYFDAGNCLLQGYPDHWIRILGHRILAVHLKNFSRSDCAGLLSGFGESLLRGDLDWAATFRALRALHYQGMLTVEMIPFSRLPNLGLPDRPLAASVLSELKSVLSACE